MNLNSLYNFIEAIFPRLSKQQAIDIVTRMNIIVFLNLLYIYIHLYFRILNLTPQEIIALVCACLSPCMLLFFCMDMGLRNLFVWVLMGVSSDTIFSQYITFWADGELGLGSKVFCVVQGVFMLTFFYFVFSILCRTICMWREIIKRQPTISPLLGSVDPKNNFEAETKPFDSHNLSSPVQKPQYGIHYYGSEV